MSASPVWRPGDDVTDDTLLKDVSRALAFGSGDLPSWLAIVEKLEGRSCTTVGALFKDWSFGEFVTSIRPLDLKKAAKSYAIALEDATERQFNKDGVIVIDAAKPALKKDTGGDTTAACKKVKTEFPAWSYTPDGRVYAGIPSALDQKYLSKDDTLAYGDALFLDAHANPEQALGDYIPDGMGKRYAYLHKKMKLPMLWPVGVRPGDDPAKGKARPIASFVALRIQNGRQGPKYKRMVLDKKFYARFGEKAREHIVWVEAGSVMLEENWRNQLMSELVDAYDGKTSRMTPNFPKARRAHRTPLTHAPLPLPRWLRRLRVRQPADHRPCCLLSAPAPRAFSLSRSLLSHVPHVCCPQRTERRTRMTKRRARRMWTSSMVRSTGAGAGAGRASASSPKASATAATTTTTTMTSRRWTAPTWPPRRQPPRLPAHRRRQSLLRAR